MTDGVLPQILETAHREARARGRHFDRKWIIWRWTHDNRIVLMHGFTKQRERIPQADLDVATQRYQVIERELRGEP
jgi:phage-related protein